jgi:hypothetical protein
MFYFVTVEKALQSATHLLFSGFGNATFATSARNNTFLTNPMTGGILNFRNRTPRPLSKGPPRT